MPSTRPVRLLLINPRPPESFWSFRWAMDTILTRQRTLNPPLGLATLAGLCPDHWQVQIADEAIEPLPVRPEVDIVGVCSMGVQHPRQRELLAYYRQQGYFTVAGSNFASLCPERLEGLVSTPAAWRRGAQDRSEPGRCASPASVAFLITRLCLCAA